MPTLNWIGKDKVVTHHLDVPYRVLEHRYTYPTLSDGIPAESENKIIRGDNLEALKALLPEYEGRVKCIYIDPPYNTGYEGWVYNDNVNDPKIRKWLGEVVGKEGEDLSRHDKWLCMMYPRLVLLQRLLSQDGVIFISIDDTEQANLRLICNEIFGIDNFVANISWQRTYSPRNDSKGIPNETDWVIVYRKSQLWMPLKLERTDDMDSRYASPDNDPRPWTSGDATAAGASTHPGMVYAVQHPITGKMLYPVNGSHWRYGQDQMLSIMNEWAPYVLRPINDYERRVDICRTSSEKVPVAINAIVLENDDDFARRISRTRYDKGVWPKLYFTNKGTGGIRCKRYLDSMNGRVATNFWPYKEVGHTDEASKELKAIFGKAPFETPKPTRLLARVLEIAADKDSIILDSFAGSGTTAHAVLKMNKQDGGNRRFLLVEMMDYAETITAERVRRVIDGYGSVEGTGGSFSFYDLGETLLNGNQSLNEAVPTQKIREYVYYMDTKQPIPPLNEEEPYKLGVYNETAFYFYYEKERATTLSHDFLATIRTQAEGYIIYADINALSEDDLRRYNITFKKIPRDIAKL